MCSCPSADAPSRNKLRVLLAQPRGFCAGVERAILIVEKALDHYGPPVYVRHEIVHNKRVLEQLRKKGAVFVEELDQIPPGSITVFSAHGVPESVEQEACRRNLSVLDATCPLVSKVHKEGAKMARNGRHIVLIGHPGHPEVIGTAGRIPGQSYLVSSVEDVASLPIPREHPLSYVTQTTLSIDDTRHIIKALHARYSDVIGPDVKNICYATQNRQQAVHKLVQITDMLLVLGAKNSSNSNRLREIGAENNKPSYLIDQAGDLDPAWLEGMDSVGITAGASAPEELVQELLSRLAMLRDIDTDTLPGIHEDIIFKLPLDLQEPDRPRSFKTP